MILCMLVCVSTVGCFAFAVRGYRGPSSDHFDGKRFYHQDYMEQRSFFDFLRWVTNRKPGKWEKWVESEFGPKPPARVDGEEIRVTFINHATFLIQTEGINILTDPIWSERTSPVSFMGPKRVRIPGIRFGMSYFHIYMIIPQLVPFPFEQVDQFDPTFGPALVDRDFVSHLIQYVAIGFINIWRFNKKDAEHQID